MRKVTVEIGEDGNLVYTYPPFYGIELFIYRKRFKQ